MTSRFAGMTEILGFFVSHLTYQLALDRLQSRCRNGPWTQRTFRLSFLIIGVVFGIKPPLQAPFFLILILSPMTGDSNTMPPCPLKVLWMPYNGHALTHPQGLTPGGLRNYAMPERSRSGFGCRFGIIISRAASLGLTLSRTRRLSCRANALTLALFGMPDPSTSWRSFIESAARRLPDRCYNRCHYVCLHRLQVVFHAGPRTFFGTTLSL